MKLWGSRTATAQRHDRTLRHQFVIGPLCDTELCEGKARLYYCAKCKWCFLVCGSRVAVLDEDGSPLVGEDNLRRFNTFEEGPCPVLETFASAALANVEAWRLPSRRKCDEPGNLAPGYIPAWTGRPRPVLRVLTRVREDL